MITVINNDLKIKVILVDTRPYLGTTSVLANDMVDYLQDPNLNFQAANTKVISHTMVTINHIEYGCIHVVKSNVKADLFIWITVHNKLQYEFICGGSQSNSISDTCNGVAATLRLQ